MLAATGSICQGWGLLRGSAAPTRGADEGLWAGQVDGAAGGSGAECHEERHLPPQAPDAGAHPCSTPWVSSQGPSPVPCWWALGTRPAGTRGGGWDGGRGPPWSLGTWGWLLGGFGGVGAAPGSCLRPLRRPRSLVLQDPDVSPLLSRGSGSGAEAEDCSSGEPPPSPARPPPAFRGDVALSSALLPAADDNPTALLGREKSPALLEEPGSSEVEEGEEDLPAAPLPASAADALPAERLGPPVLLPLSGPAGTEGLAEAALEDGGCHGGLHQRPPPSDATLSPRELNPKTTSSPLRSQWKTCGS